MGGTSTWIKIREVIKDGFKFTGKYILPILVQLAPQLKIPAWAATVVMAVLPDLMAVAEKDFPAAGSGTMKKNQVLTAINDMLAVVDKYLTGGAAATYDRLLPLLNTAIDSVVSATNELRKDIIADDEGPQVPPTVGSGINAPVDSP
mgnify:CR=1 FL=1